MNAGEEQLKFKSIAFPADRKPLRVEEIAARWSCSAQHILDLLEEGKLVGFDVAGRHDWMRVPKAALEVIAQRTRVTTAELLQIIAAARPTKRIGRTCWRIPVEGYNDFVRNNHSCAL